MHGPLEEEEEEGRALNLVKVGVEEEAVECLKEWGGRASLPFTTYPFSHHPCLLPVARMKGRRDGGREGGGKGILDIVGFQEGG